MNKAQIKQRAMQATRDFVPDGTPPEEIRRRYEAYVEHFEREARRSPEQRAARFKEMAKRARAALGTPEPVARIEPKQLEKPPVYEQEELSA